MIWLSNLLEEIENRINDEQNGFQHVCQGIVVAVEERTGDVKYGYRKKDYGKGENDDPELLVAHQLVDEIRQQTIFDNIKKIEIELGDDVEDFVVVAVN
ncbi:hypothetical protein [Dinghuibacter silviterrae]|uniref:hypothetical protein n=1 Tax=Dinghuibacter silviterrae TaxID=1539049 RepID=UPI001063ACFE|nr:hypothetical protein [Dinghuibacter silviterrae]